MSPGTETALTVVVFAFVYVGLAVGKLPLLRLDRAGIALVGATAMLVLGLIGFDQAVAAVDFRTIALLFGMMVVVAYLRVAGFFTRLADALFERIRSPHGLLAAIVGLTGLLSALLVNDVVCLALGPVVLALARRVRRGPAPYLVALATAANVGSAATITGNPQNMIIGTLSRIPYAAFAARLGPVALAGLVLVYAAVAVAYRRALARELPPPEHAPEHAELDVPPGLLPRGVLVLVALVVLLFAGAPVELAALGAASALMVGRLAARQIYARVDWSLLLLFAGLFTVVHAFEVHVASRWGMERLASLPRPPVILLTAASALLSNLVSNVPAVLLLKSAILSLAPAARPAGWLVLAMASTLAGNLTPIASVANLIVLEGARREGVEVSAWEYCVVGVPVTLATLAVGAAWLGLT